MLMVGLAPCAFSLTEGDYSRKKSHGNVLPSVLSRQIQQCRKAHHCSRATISKQNVQNFYGLQFTQPSPGWKFNGTIPGRSVSLLWACPAPTPSPLLHW
ncbi:uncharacterized protein [Triticum aestivum]|uniref:uncharacterized protein isoform X4 n=1 Tax=Triticum aestivum TaxID=4565 RepID=UPI001D002F95|nr:uncharacterized protein LOC123098508 isoform X4 [Triticum aestivum]